MASGAMTRTGATDVEQHPNVFVVKAVVDHLSSTIILTFVDAYVTLTHIDTNSGRDDIMHSYWLYSIGADRAERLRHEAQQHRMVAMARTPRVDLGTRLRNRLGMLLPSIASQPQPCPC